MPGGRVPSPPLITSRCGGLVLAGGERHTRAAWLPLREGGCGGRGVHSARGRPHPSRSRHSPSLLFSPFPRPRLTLANGDEDSESIPTPIPTPGCGDASWSLGLSSPLGLLPRGAHPAPRPGLPLAREPAPLSSGLFCPSTTHPRQLQCRCHRTETGFFPISLPDP